MIDYQFNKHNLKQRRQSLRNTMAQPESQLWLKIRGSQLMGYKFRRQYGVGNYIVDFYCPELRLAIEIDGNSHFIEKAQEYDSEREQYLNSFNIKVLRFTNNEVTKNLNGVLGKIVETINTTTPNPS